uniref:Uncharacterized protein n=1 Tax=Arundo donax TaxID=35708 RepID=A0A0A9FT66_ARUDO
MLNSLILKCVDWDSLMPIHMRRQRNHSKAGCHATSLFPFLLLVALAFFCIPGNYG